MARSATSNLSSKTSRISDRILVSNHPSREEILPNLQSKPSVAQLKTLFPGPITNSLGEEAKPPLAPTSFHTSLVPAVLLSGWHDVKFLVSCLEGTKGLALLTPQTQTINPQFKDHLYQRTLLSLLRMTWMLLSPARF